MSKHAHVEIESIYGGFDATWWIFYSFILSMIFTCIYLAYCNSYRNESQLVQNLFENLERRYFERFWYRKKSKPYQTTSSLVSVQTGMKWWKVFSEYSQNRVT